MKHLPWKFSGIPGSPVKTIPRHRMTKRCHVHTYLMRTSGFRVDLYQREQSRHHGGKQLIVTLHVVVGHGRTAILHHGHAFTLTRVPPDRRINASSGRRQMSLNQGQVGFFDLSGLELLLQIAVRLVVFGDHHQAGGLFVQSVSNISVFAKSVFYLMCK